MADATVQQAYLGEEL
ncbi:hypothetical protein ABZ372_43420 [Streptomyces sp. NPDC005921]